jgi:phosphatidylglycerol lysyltransferase
LKSAPEFARIRQLVLQHGWNVTSYQLLNPGIRHWFSAEGDAVVGYVSWRGVWIVAGAPVCAGERLAAVVESFEALARQHRKRVCYFGAAGRLRTLLHSQDCYSSVILGAQPMWKPQNWAAVIDNHASLRAQVNRARNKSIVIREWTAQQAEGNPCLQCIQHEWLQTRGLPPLHFLVEAQTFSYLFDRRIFVAQRNELPVGFLTLSPVPRRNGWLTEQFVRGAEAPNGTIELLLDTALRTVAAEGAEYLTMGLVPLSQYGPPEENNPLWLRLLLHWVKAHGRRFYNFGGLEAFKAKFCPDAWEPIWAISREPFFSPATLWAITGAFSRQPPSRLILRGLGRALRQEYLHLSRR